MKGRAAVKAGIRTRLFLPEKTVLFHFRIKREKKSNQASHPSRRHGSGTRTPAGKWANGIHHWFRSLKVQANNEEWGLIHDVTFHDLRHDFAHRARAAA